MLSRPSVIVHPSCVQLFIQPIHSHPLGFSCHERQADDSAFKEARKRNQYQQEVRRHALEQLQRENAQIFARISTAAARPSFETQPSDFTLSRIGSRLVTSGR